MRALPPPSTGAPATCSPTASPQGDPTVSDAAIDDTKNAGAIPIVASVVLFFAAIALNQPLLLPFGLASFVAGLVVRTRTRRRAVRALDDEDRTAAAARLKKARLIVLLIVLAGALRFALVEILGGR